MIQQRTSIVLVACASLGIIVTLIMSKFNVYITVLPFTWLLCYLLCMKKVIKGTRETFTAYAYIFLSFIIYVVTPLLRSFSVTNITDFEFSKSTIMMSYALLFSSIWLYLYSMTEKCKYIKFDNKASLGGSRIVYAVFVIFALVIYLVYGNKLDVLRFLFVSSSDSVFADIENTNIVLIRTIITSGISILYILIVSGCKSKYDRNNKRRYVFFVLIASCANICVIVGQRRSQQLYLCLLLLYLLIPLFPKERKLLIRTIPTVALAVLIGMTVYKHFAAYLYDSYWAALKAQGLNITNINQIFDSYFLGLDEVRRSFIFVDNSHLGFSQMLYDVLRSTFGISFLVKGKNVTTGLYNMYLYSGTQTNGHLLPAISYGSIYFKSLLSPIIICLNLFISMRFEILCKSTRFLEQKYLFGLIMIRYATSIFTAPVSLWSYTTNTLGTLGLICLLGALVKNCKSYPT